MMVEVPLVPTLPLELINNDKSNQQTKNKSAISDSTSWLCVILSAVTLQKKKNHGSLHSGDRPHSTSMFSSACSSPSKASGFPGIFDLMLVGVSNQSKQRASEGRKHGRTQKTQSCSKPAKWRYSHGDRGFS